MSEEIKSADENGDPKNAAEQNLTESISAVSEQEVAINTKTVSQSSLFDEQSQDGGLADKNPQLDGAKDGDLADKFDGVYQNSQANLDENEVGDESGRVPSKNIFKEKAQNSLFDEQGSEWSEPVAGVDDKNLQILPMLGDIILCPEFAHKQATKNLYLHSWFDYLSKCMYKFFLGRFL